MTLGTLSPEMEEGDSKLGRILNPQGISEPLPGAAVTLVRSRGDTCLTPFFLALCHQPVAHTLLEIMEA